MFRSNSDHLFSNFTLPIKFILWGKLKLTPLTCMGIPEGRVRSMDGSHRGKVFRITVPIIFFNGTRLNIFNFEKYFLTFGLTKLI